MTAGCGECGENVLIDDLLLSAALWDHLLDEHLGLVVAGRQREVEFTYGDRIVTVQS